MRTRAWRLAFALAVTFGAGRLVTTLAAQTPVNGAAFEVASVKPSKSENATSTLGQRGGYVAVSSFSLRMLLGSTYNLDLNRAGQEIFGLPGWGDSDRFDIQAEAPGNPTVEQKRAMLLVVLVERFKIAMHHETRQVPIFGLVLMRAGQLGPDLHPHAETAVCSASAPRVDLPGAAAAMRRTSPGDAAAALVQQFPCGRIVGGLLQDRHDQAWSGGRRVTIKQIAEAIGGMGPMERRVVDQTGIDGAFDFTVVWNPQIPDVSPSGASDPLGFARIPALREQLGLRLEATRGPIDVLVIDHVEHPTED